MSITNAIVCLMIVLLPVSVLAMIDAFGSRFMNPIIYPTPTVYVGTTTKIPDNQEVVILPEAAATNISQILSFAQSDAIGQITSISIRGFGFCTVAPTVTITNIGGINGAATAILDDYSVATLAGSNVFYKITNSGSGITSATASLSGGTCSTPPVIGEVNIGLRNVMDGRTIALINESGNTQTLVDGQWIKLAGGMNVEMTNHSTMTFHITSGGVWHEVSRELQ